MAQREYKSALRKSWTWLEHCGSLAAERGRRESEQESLSLSLDQMEEDDLEKGRIEVNNVKAKLLNAFDEKGVVHGIGEEEEALWCASCWNEVL